MLTSDPTRDPPVTPDLAPLYSALDDHSDVELAIVYGSVAAGTASPESDLDVAVAGQQRLSVEGRLALVEALAQRAGRPVDLVDLRDAHGPLLAVILQTGIRVVERDAALYGTLLSRHLIDESDFRPYRDRILADRRQAWIGAS